MHGGGVDFSFVDTKSEVMVEHAVPETSALIALLLTEIGGSDRASLKFGLAVEILPNQTSSEPLTMTVKVNKPLTGLARQAQRSRRQLLLL